MRLKADICTTSETPGCLLKSILNSLFVLLTHFKYLKSMHSLSQIFAGMSRTTSNLYIECLICRSPGNDNTCFVGIVENNAICDMPGSTVKTRCTTHTSFFL